MYIPSTDGLTDLTKEMKCTNPYHSLTHPVPRVEL